MRDTFTGWIEGFPTQTEKAEEVVKNPNKQTKKNCFMKSFWDLVCPGYYKATMGSFISKVTQEVLKALGITYYLHCAWREASVFRKSRKSQPIVKISDKNDNPGDLPGMEGGFTKSSPPHLYCP